MNRYSGIADKLITDSAQKASRYDKAFMLTERYSYLPIRTPTGIASLDTCLGGGLAEKTLTVIRGIPGAGKTTFVIQN